MLALLSRLPAAERPTLCHRVVDGLCGREPPRQAEYSAAWSPEEWLQLTHALTALYSLAVRNNTCEEEVLAGLADGGGGGHSEAVLDVLRSRREEIHRALLDRTSAVSNRTLQDFDWQLKLALSSDKLSSLQTPLLSLSLDLRGGQGLQPVAMEMDRDELNTLVCSLEAANKVLLQLK